MWWRRAVLPSLPSLSLFFLSFPRSSAACFFLFRTSAVTGQAHKCPTSKCSDHGHDTLVSLDPTRLVPRTNEKKDLCENDKTWRSTRPTPPTVRPSPTLSLCLSVVREEMRGVARWRSPRLASGAATPPSTDDVRILDGKRHLGCVFHLRTPCVSTMIGFSTKI